jgi:signal peptidase II
VLVAVVAVDQVVKALVRGEIAVGDHETLIGGVLKLVHVRNSGVAFGAFSGGGAIVVVLVVVALVALLLYFATHVHQPLVWLPTGLLLGGAIGNIVDRITRGEVTDFIKVPHWPAFNVADIAVTFGVLALLWAIELGERQRAPERRAG